MLSRLVQFCLSQRLFVLLATLLVAGAGWVAYLGLPIDAFPDVSSTQVKIIMKAPGMTPEEVESRIAVPIEVEMLGIPKTRILRSVTKYGLVDQTRDAARGLYCQAEVTPIENPCLAALQIGRDRRKTRRHRFDLQRSHPLDDKAPDGVTAEQTQFRKDPVA